MTINAVEIEDIQLLKEKDNVELQRKVKLFISISVIIATVALFTLLLYFLVLKQNDINDDDDSKLGNYRLDSILQEGIDNMVYPGVVAVAGTLDGIVYKNNVGRYSYSSKDPSIKLDTNFDLASLTKVVATTSGIALLYQQGYLSLDTNVTSILGSDFANGGKENIKVIHCLLHNAGFAPDPSPRYWETSFGCPNTDDAFPAEDFSCLDPFIYTSFMSETLIHSPGEIYLYSDLSFITLQLVIGKVALDNDLVSNQDTAECLSFGPASSMINMTCAFKAYLHKEIFGLPVQSTGASWMPHTRYLLPEEEWSRTAPTNNDTGDGSYTHKRIQGQVADGNAYAMGERITAGSW
jgi:hypothetical protein